jgi:hypothetical protein
VPHTVAATLAGARVAVSSGMTQTVTVEEAIDVDAPVEVVWATAVDWARQDSWMLATSVRPVTQAGRGVGARLEAATGVGPLRFVDTMTVDVWQPPSICRVRHTGRVVRGTGTFSVRAQQRGARFVWREDLELPLGALGHVGWLVLRPPVVAAMRTSLARFRRLCVV